MDTYSRSMGPAFLLGQFLAESKAGLPSWLHAPYIPAINHALEYVWAYQVSSTVAIVSMSFTSPLRCLFHISRQFLIFDVSNMEIVFEGRDSRSWIRACCFSPDGKSFAVASTDNKVYIYDSKSYALKAKVTNCVSVGG